MSTLTGILSEASLPALIPTQTSFPAISHKTLSNAVARFASDLASAGIGRGDVVSMSVINGVEFVVGFLGTGAASAVSSPLNPAYSPGEVKFYLEDCKSKLLLVATGAVAANSDAVKAAQEFKIPIAEVSWDSNLGQLRLEVKVGRVGNSQRLQNPQPDDVALVLHTSGTTGRPKAVPLSHLNLCTTIKNIVNTYSLTDRDRTYLVMPLFHVHGLLCGLLAPLSVKSSIVIPPKFSASVFWKEFTEHSCTWYTAVPTIHQILLASPIPNPVPSIRFIRSCSSALSPTTFHDLEKKFNAPVLEAYAMTEASHQMTSNPLPPAKRKPGTVGLGQGVEVRILSLNSDEQVEEGEVCIRGANVTRGYINNEKANKESFTKDGFFRTGDRGKLDEDGYVVLTGRIKELINRGGEKISPLEVDAALLAITWVAEAVAFGVPDPTYVERVWATVVPKEGVKLNEFALKKELKGKLSKFKVPEKIFITTQIPKTATGKIQRKNVAKKFLEEDARSEKTKAKL
ncbi:acetyl-CoA synthetase-like protein [Atractiella rhizophila]|nr:acetyl-CoA synthetase-like protein [Atractiella rhizophila]